MDIVIRDLCKSYGERKVLSHFSACLAEGSLTCLMGESGCGKTTLMEILLGLRPCDSGEIEGLSGRQCSAVFQEDRLCENLTAVANVRLVCPKSVSRGEIEAELAAVGLGDSLDKPVREFSGGMRRRAAIVRGMMAPFDVIFLDEPFHGLDEQTRETAMLYVKRRIAGNTALLITHDPREAQFMGGVVLHMDRLENETN